MQNDFSRAVVSSISLLSRIVNMPAPPHQTSNAFSKYTFYFNCNIAQISPRRYESIARNYFSSNISEIKYGDRKKVFHTRYWIELCTIKFDDKRKLKTSMGEFHHHRLGSRASALDSRNLESNGVYNITEINVNKCRGLVLVSLRRWIFMALAMKRGRWLLRTLGPRGNTARRESSDGCYYSKYNESVTLALNNFVLDSIAAHVLGHSLNLSSAHRYTQFSLH